MEARVDSYDNVPTTDSVEPTPSAEFKFKLERKQFKGAVAVKVPGQRAGLLLKIVIAFGIVTAGGSLGRTRTSVEA